MSIASVVCRGYGPDPSIGGVVLRGYFDTGGGPAVVVDTTDHADGGYEWEHISRRVGEIRKLRRKDDRKRREAQERLTTLIEAAYNRALGIEPEVAQELAAAAVQAEQARPVRREDIDQPLVRYDWGALARDLTGLEELLRRIDARRVDDLAREAADEDEDDIMILLMAAG